MRQFMSADIFTTNRLHSGVLLSERPAQCLDAIRDALEIVLLFACYLINSGVVICVAPLDVECVEIDLDIETVHVFRGVRWEPAKLGHEGK